MQSELRFECNVKKEMSISHNQIEIQLLLFGLKNVQWWTGRRSELHRLNEKWVSIENGLFAFYTRIFVNNKRRESDYTEWKAVMVARERTHTHFSGVLFDYYHR